MDTQEIYAALKTNPSTKDCFNFVYPIDKLPPKNSLKYNSRGEGFVVVNTDPSYKKGSHWIALCISPSQFSADEYFDSYGEEPPEEIKNYLGGNCLRQKRQLQSFETTVCGQWCIFYIWKRCCGLSLGDIVKQFKGNSPVENDQFVNAKINACFPGKDQPLLDASLIVEQIATSYNEWKRRT